MSSAPPDLLAGTVINDLRRDPSLAPGGERHDDLLRAFLPMVNGTAHALLPESPEAADQVAPAVFQAFAMRWRKLARPEPVATWMLRTARLVALRERKRLRLPAPPKGSDARALFAWLAAFEKLPSKFQHAVVLRAVLKQSPAWSARTVRVREATIEKHFTRGTARLTRALGKRHAMLAPVIPEQLQSAPSAEKAEAILATARDWKADAPRTPLASGAISSWRWIGFRRTMRVISACLGIVLALLVSAGVTFAYLAHNGYLNNFFLSQQRKQYQTQYPGLTEPAKPWPVSDEDKSRVRQKLPTTTEELYATTNIWTARLRLTEEQWSGITPKRIERGRMQENGRLSLRNPKAERSGLAGVFGLHFDYTPGIIEFADATFENVAIRYRGNGTFFNSQFGPKQSFKVDLNKYVKGQDIAGINTLNFVNAVPDDTYLRDALAEQVFRGLGVPGPRTSYAYLSIDVPGRFENQALGLYVLIENIDGDYAKDRFGTKKTPIFKPVTYELFHDIGDTWKAYEDIYDLKTDATPEQLARVVEFAKLTSHATDEEFAAKLAEYLDIEEFAAFVAGHVLLASYDGFLENGQNFYMYLHPRSNKFGFISWDQDHSWGEFGYVGTPERRENASIWNPTTYDFKFLKRVMKVEAFRSAYVAKLEEGLARHLRKDLLWAQVDQMAALLRPAVAAESEFRLKRFDAAVSSEWPEGPRQNGHAEGPGSIVQPIKRFIENRAKSIRDQLDGKSEGLRMSRDR